MEKVQMLLLFRTPKSSSFALWIQENHGVYEGYVAILGGYCTNHGRGANIVVLKDPKNPPSTEKYKNAQKTAKVVMSDLLQLNAKVKKEVINISKFYQKEMKGQNFLQNLE
jgi:hypothetical protein